MDEVVDAAELRTRVESGAQHVLPPATRKCLLERRDRSGERDLSHERGEGSEPRLQRPRRTSREATAPSVVLDIIAAVPRISEFYGIVIDMYYGDHPPPHFHARYVGDGAKIAIASGEILAGSLPVRALRLVREWVEEHRGELEANWERAVRHERPRSIDPLR